MANHSDNEKKPIYKKWWFWLIVIIILIIILGNNQELKKGVNDGYNDKMNNNLQTELKTSFEWTNQGTDEQMTTYLVLIGNNEYSDGQAYEKIEKGIYNFKQNNNRKLFSIETERIYNIYVTDKYIPLDDFEKEKVNYIEGTVGGINGQEIDLELKDGQFLYLQNVKGGEHGHLVVNKK